jgi:hypothetical protein
MGSRGYNSRAYVSNAPGAFYVAYQGDFGATTPGAPTLTYEAASGSFASETVYVEITWITAAGESVAGASTAVGVTSAEGAIKVVPAAAPTNGATVTGFRVYENTSSGGSGGPVLVLAANSYTAQQTINGVPNAYPASAISGGIQLKSQSVSTSVPPAVDHSGIQPALPSIASDATVDYYFIVPNTGSQWKTQKSVQYMRSDGIADPAGIELSQMDFVQPVYPGSNIASGTSQANWVVNAGSWTVINGYLYQATVGGAVGSTFPTTFAANTAKGSTVTDGSVTWTCFGKAGVIRAVFGNLSGSAAIPAAQAYELFQL